MGKLALFLIGLIVGIAVCAAFIAFAAPGLMLKEFPSGYDLKTTVERIEKAAKDDGWVVSGVRKLDESVKKHGGPEIRPVRLIDLCHAEHAGKILREDGARRVSVFMPCTISVYEKSDGTVWVAHMQPGMMGKLFGGVVAEVMSGPVTEAQEKFLDAVR